MSRSPKQVHLQMIQAVVNRLSQNSFLLKGWSVLLISALFTLATKEQNHRLVYLALFPVAAFHGDRKLNLFWTSFRRHLTANKH